MNEYDSASSAFHAEFDANAKPIIERARDELLESITSASPEQIIGQIIMNFLDDGFVSDNGPDAVFKGQFGTEHKEALVRLADHLGPDWAQALYHAAVFITKVA